PADGGCSPGLGPGIVPSFSCRPQLLTDELKFLTAPRAVEDRLDLELPPVEPHPLPRLNAPAPADGDAVIRLDVRLLRLEVGAPTQSLDGRPHGRDGLPHRFRQRLAPLVAALNVAANFDAVAQLSNLNHHRRHHPAARRSAARTAGRPA